MDYLGILTPTIESMGGFGYWLVFFISFFESLAFVGNLVPGSILIYLAGFLSAQGYLNIINLMWFTSAGAICGDGLSYFLGTKGKHFFRNENRFLKLSHLEKGEEFFRKHGPKSVFLGRFVGPLRPIIPFVAGLSRMNRATFFAWNISSAVLWSVSHLLVGYFFGGAIGVVEAWTTRAGMIIVSLLAVLAVLWLGLKASGPVVTYARSLWSSARTLFAEKSPALYRFISERADAEKFSGRPLTLLSVASVYVLFLLFGSVQSALSSAAIVLYDERVANLLLSFRDTGLIKFFTVVSLLAKWQVVFVLAIVVTMIMRLRRKEFYIPAMWAVIGGGELFRWLGSIAFYKHRPESSFYLINSSSFPSGHAVLASAFYGFLVYVMVRHSTAWGRKANIMFAGSAVILGIGFAALYLGESFLSDVWGGYLLGLLCLLIGISFAELLRSREAHHEHEAAHNAGIFSAVLIAAWLVFYAGYSLRYNPSVSAAADNEKYVSVAGAAEIFDGGKAPKLAEKLFGNDKQPVNFVMIAKDDGELVGALNAAGWVTSDPIDAGTLLELISSEMTNKIYVEAPMTPAFWNTDTNDFGFEKATARADAYSRHHLRVWDTRFKTAEGKVYVGTVRLDTVNWIIVHRTDPNADAERELLLSDLNTAGVITRSAKFRMTEPIAQGTGTHETPFFTDGEAYEVVLR